MAREVIAGGTALITMTAAVSVQPYLDAVILSKLAPADAVGWFGAAKNVMGTLLARRSSSAPPSFPALPSRVERGHLPPGGPGGAAADSLDRGAGRNRHRPLRRRSGRDHLR